MNGTDCPHCDGSGVLNVTDWFTGTEYPSWCHGCEMGKEWRGILE